MVERTDWEARARGIIRGEMARKGITYARLVERLAEIGVVEDERNLRNKVSRGKFTAAFLLQCATALGLTTISLDTRERQQPGGQKGLHHYPDGKTS